MRTPAQRCLSAALVVAVGLATAAPAGAMARRRKNQPSEEERTMQFAAELFAEGLAKYDLSEYEDALQLWQEAYEMVPPTDENSQVQADLIYNIAQARQKLYEVSEDERHLRLAKDNLQQYLEATSHLRGNAEYAAEENKVRDKIAEIDRAIDAIQSAKDAEEAAQREAELRRQAAAQKKRNYVITGYSMLGVGAVGLSLMGAGLGLGLRASDDFTTQPSRFAPGGAQDRGVRANALGYVGGVLGGIGVVAGVTLLRLAYSQAGNTPRAAVVPTGRGVAGVLRF